MGKFTLNSSSIPIVIRSAEVHAGVKFYADELFEIANTEGVGTKNNRSPAGGVPVDTGELQGSGAVHDLGTGNGFELRWDADHASYVYDGTRDQPPNRWVDRAISVLARAVK